MNVPKYFILLNKSLWAPFHFYTKVAHFYFAEVPRKFRGNYQASTDIKF
jgi:hypothetical protein